MKKHILLVLIALHIHIFRAYSATILINFDTDASGNPITAPGLFVDTTRLTELYAPLGVHFAGVTGNDGGAILNQSGNFGVNARSGTNFFAFNREAAMMNGGIARDPETITFDTLMSDVSIFAAGGDSTKTFLMQAFGTNGGLLDTSTVASQAFSELRVASPSGIKSVRLSVTVPPSGGAFVFDDLSAHTVPEPSPPLFLAIGSAIVLSMRMANIKRNKMV